MNLQLIRKITGGVALLCASFAFASQALAAVPLARVIVAKSGGNYTTITAAMAAIAPTAAAPYVIEVWPGVYTEPGTVIMKSFVHLKGSGRDITTVKTALGTTADVVSASQLTNVDISGLTITGGMFGINYYTTSGTISENTTSNNYVGISIKNSTASTIPSYSTIITGNKILNNNQYSGIEISNATLVVTNNILSGNAKVGSGNGGIYMYNAGNSIISGNLITANNGWGIYVQSSSSPTISNNVISNNALAGLEFEANYVASESSVTNNKLVNNGGTVYTDIVIAAAGVMMPKINFNIFDDITGDRGVGSYNVNSNGDPILVP